jgi:hypothetical protein
MIHGNICPKCGRRYHASKKICLDCGTALVSRDPLVNAMAKKRANKKVARYLLGVAAIGIAICAVWFAILPLLDYSMQSGQEFSKHVSPYPSNASEDLPRYAMNQAIGNDKLEVTVTRTREGSSIIGGNRFYIVSITLRNLRSDAPIQVSNSDFTLVDADGNLYFTYNIGNGEVQVLDPLQTQSYEMEFKIPRDATGLTLQFYSPQSAGGDGSVPVLFSLK